MSQKYVEIDTSHGLEYQCVCCDFHCMSLHLMFGHIASEHCKPKQGKSKRKAKIDRLELPIKGVSNGRFIP